MSFPLQPKQHVQWHSFEECMEHLNDIVENASSKPHENVYFSTVCPSQLLSIFQDTTEKKERNDISQTPTHEENLASIDTFLMEASL